MDKQENKETVSALDKENKQRCAEKPVKKLSVRELCEYCLTKGDLSPAGGSISALWEGTRVHKIVQARYLKKHEDYKSELSLSIDIPRESYMLRLGGRADGFYTDNGLACVHEIKSTVCPLADINEGFNEVYNAQLYVYAYIYARQNGLPQIKTRISYHPYSGRGEKAFERIWTFNELEKFFNLLIEDYLKISDIIMTHLISRDRELEKLKFPFNSYRPSQRELTSQVYTALKQGNTLFVEAPTGTGKTIATLFPALKAMGRGICDKIFYLTAKNQTGKVAEDTLERLKGNGLPLKSIFITAKDKMCLLKSRNCSPVYCEYCRDYFTRLHSSMPELLKHNSFTYKFLREAGRKYNICPFELSLTLSEYCDVIICDYNYVFNPSARLKRYFGEEKGKYAFLIDEAHNLVERARDMFSASMSRAKLQRAVQALNGTLPRVKKGVEGIISALDAVSAQSNEQAFLLSPPQALYNSCLICLEIIDGLNESERPLLPPETGELVLSLLDYTTVSGYYSEEYHTCYAKRESAPKEDFSVNLLCLQPSAYVRMGLNYARGSVLFSATLTPHEYYLNNLGADEKTYYFALEPPFDPDNMLVIAEDRITTTYSARQRTCPEITKLIHDAVSVQPGNYLVFFPSYAYLDAVLQLYISRYKEKPLVHTPGMSKKDKDAFLKAFDNTQNPVLGFSVLGGHFGEGIDLPGKRLLGAVIVGVGLPQLCLERNLIQKYFSEQYMDGYAYAYIFPGLNRVLQAAGRVIRTAQDRGIVLLIDERFARPPYNELMPEHWNVRYASQEDLSVTEMIEEFWED